MDHGKTRQQGLPFGIGETCLVLIAMLVLSMSSVANADDTTGERLSQTSKGAGEARETKEFDAVTTDSFGELREEGDTSKAATKSVAKTTGPARQEESAYGDYWVYSVDVELFNDDDRDGYFHGIDVLFDVDTIYAVTDVYAVAYLSYEGGPWNEYAVSEDITLFGTTSTDDYVLVTELLQGYPSGSYDLLIEIYEVDTGLYVASAGPGESFELVDLPLEDADRDLPPPSAPVVRNYGGGGSNSLPFLIALLGALLLARQRASKE